MKKKSVKKFSKAKEQTVTESILWGGLKSLTLSIVVLSVLLFAGAAVAMSQNDPNGLCAPIGYAASAVTLFFSGVFAAKFCKNAPIVCALISGSVLALTAFGANILMGEGECGALGFLFCVFPLISVVGCLIACSKKGSKHKKFKNS